MRPLFTVHAGEYLVAEYLEHTFKDKGLHVWVPTKDTGVDLLITDKANRKAVSLQVKMSKDYKNPVAVNSFDEHIVAGGWLALAHKKIEASPADYWVLVVVSMGRTTDPQYIVVKPSVLLKKLQEIHGKSTTYQTYPTIMSLPHFDRPTALDVRGMSKKDKGSLETGTFSLGARDFSQFLNSDGWKIVMDQLS